MNSRRQSAGNASLVRQLFQEAMALHQGGRLAEATQRYRAVLAIAPYHAQCLPLFGVALAQQGRNDEAAEMLRRALERNPDAPEIHNNLGMVLNATKRYEDAADQFRTALALNPRYAIAHNNLGNALSALDRKDAAIESFEAALAIDPNYPEALSNLGSVLFDLRRLDESVAWLKKAIAIRPVLAEAHMNLGAALSALGRFDEAIASLERALIQRPDYAEAEINLGKALIALERATDAVKHLEKALALQPDLAEAHVNMGLALLALERRDEALARFERALVLRPNMAEAEMNCGIALLALHRRAEALERFERAVAAKPGSAEAEMHLGLGLSAVDRNDEAIPHLERALALRANFPEAELNLGRALLTEERQSEALDRFERAIALKPDFVEAIEQLGATLQEVGRIEDGRLSLERAVTINPKRPQAYLYLANSAKVATGDPLVATLEAFLRDQRSMTEDDRIHLHFALGKALGDIGRNERSFRHYLEANALRRRQFDYDEARILGRNDRIRAVFTPDLMKRLGGNGDPSSAPIFIIGMPRSGSTLVEQILASHPKVFARGERMDFARSVRAIGLDELLNHYPEPVPTLDAAKLGRMYLARVEASRTAASADRLQPATERFTDKVLANFVFAGLIHLALPNARIIHTMRDPIDTCLSCFSILFFGNQPYTFELGELGRYYRSYVALMDHWRAVLPPGVMLDVRYDETVNDLETQARRIVAHCGLDWDDRCLSFHETERPVRTASVLQVRQPLYRSSLRRWRPDDATLAPLLAGLNGA